MIDILKIVGPDAFERLKRLNLDNESELKRIGVERLMSVAGIGPERTKKLFRALRRPFNTTFVKRKYRGLKDRTKFSGFKAKVRKVVAQPQPTIDKLEDTRRTLHSLNELAKSISNLRFDPGSPKRRPPEIFARVPIETQLSLSPQSLSIRGAELHLVTDVESDQTNQIWIVTSSLFDTSTSQQVKSLSDNVERGPLVNSTSVGKLVVVLEAHRKILTSPRGLWVINMPFIETKLEQIIDSQVYPKEIKDGTIITNGSPQMYARWEPYFKHANNQEFRLMMSRFDDYRIFFHYRAYRKSMKDEGRSIATFDTFKDRQLGKVEYHLGLLEAMEKKTQKRGSPRFVMRFDKNAYFGLIEAFSDTFGYRQKGFREIARPTANGSLPSDYTDFTGSVKDTKAKLDDWMIPQSWVEIAAHTMMDDYEPWYKSDISPLLFRSNKFQEFGFIFFKDMADKDEEEGGVF